MRRNSRPAGLGARSVGLLILLSSLMSAPSHVPSAATAAEPVCISQSAMVDARAGHTATLLPDGTVLVTGGSTAGPITLPNAEVFEPSTSAWLHEAFRQPG